jgi:hypothetical protein
MATLLQIAKASKSYGDQVLLDNAQTPMLRTIQHCPEISQLQA